MERLAQDLKLAARRLFKDRAFSAAALLTLVLCLGANTAIYTVVQAVLLRPLPFPESERVVLQYNSYPNVGATRGDSGVPDYFDRLRDLTVFETLAMFRDRGFTITAPGGGAGTDAERVRGIAATPSFFELMRTPAYRGRLLRPEDAETGAEHKVILSHALWQRLFAGSDAALGRDLRINGVPFTVIGVMPADFALAGTPAELWTPLVFTPDEKADASRHSNNGTILGRLRPGATVEQAQHEIDALNARNLERFPAMKQILIDAGFHTVAVELHADLVRDLQPVLLLLWGAALAVLLIGGVNVTNLLLARANTRAKEIATRRALGAGAASIARQWIAETCLLTMSAGLGGLAVGQLALRALRLLPADALPTMSLLRNVDLDPRAIAVMLGLAAVLGVVVGLVPVLGGGRAGRADLNSALREESRGGTRGRAARRSRQALVAAQVAFAFVLLASAGLLLLSFRRVLAVDPGFSPDGILTASLSLPAARYKTDADLRAFADRALAAARSIPGVSAAGITTIVPFQGNYTDSVLIPEGKVIGKGESLISPNQVTISAGYLETMNTSVVRGRAFGPGDDGGAPRVVLLDQSLAQRFWPGQDPIGRRVYQPGDPEHMAAGPTTQYFTVVGIVRDVKLRALVATDDRLGTCYTPLAQVPERGSSVVLRTAGDPHNVAAPLRRAIATLDPELPVFGMKTMNERLQETLVARRLPMLLAVAFGAVALLLAAIGIYGVLAYQVAQRTREIGIRMALGGTARSISTLILSESARMVGLGLAVGAAGALAAGHAIRGLLFGIEPTDARVVLCVALLLGAVALAAAFLPARRAQAVDPASALSE